MTNIIVVLPKIEDAKNMKNLLVRNGFSVTGVCTTGAQTVAQADCLSDGLIISGYKLPDMIYSEMKEYLPEGFDMLLVASQHVLSSCGCVEGIMCLTMPFNIHDMVNTVDMMIQGIERRRRKRREQPRARSAKEAELIKNAKILLMSRNHMTEDEAHKYIQRTSMDSGTNLVETAQMVLSLLK